MIYIFDNDMKFLTATDNSYLAHKYIAKFNIKNAKVLKDVNTMNYISRIVFVDDKCIYNNKNFWSKDGFIVLQNFHSHELKDILGQPIDYNRFAEELYSNADRLSKIDGRPGQIDYNMQVGKEFVSLFREECILTNFTKDSDTSPMKIFEKLTPVIAMLDAGAFREAKQYLAGYRQMLKDDFLTDERIDKYIAMLDAADAIEYATEEDYFYTAPETEA